MKSHKQLLPLLEKAKEEWKKSKTIQDMCTEYDVDVNFIDLVPMAFDENLEVSARTDKGCIYFNNKLIDNFLEDNLHYGAHELKHTFQQCFGAGPTQGAADGEYLDNKFEQEGFRAQTEYLSETEGNEAAEAYVDKVLDHHDVEKKDRKEKQKDLLSIAVETFIKK